MGNPGHHTADEAVEECRRRGVRLTAPRRAVLDALVSVGAHPTADDLVAYLADHHPGIHRSSIYRTLDTFGEAGIVSHVHLGHGGAIYHLTGPPDIHLVCSGCGRVSHVSATVMDEARRSVAGLNGFELDPGHLALSGTCADCQKELPEGV